MKEERQRQERGRARVERERLEREQQRRRPSKTDASTGDEIGETSITDFLRSQAATPSWANLSEPLSTPMLDLTPPKHVYERLLPDHVVDVSIRNVGRAAAYDVTGWVWFDKEVVEPVDYFASSDVEVTGEADGKVKVTLSVGNEGGRLFPSYNDPCTFRVPLRLRKVADTSFEFEFTSTQGEPAHGTFNLRIASGSQGVNG